MTKIKFKCPRCSLEIGIEEILRDVTVTTPITGVDLECEELEYGDASNGGGEVYQYQCIACGNLLKSDVATKVSDVDGLISWLQEHDMLGKEGE